MTTFIAVYRGSTIAEAKLIAVSADPALVAEVSTKLLDASREKEADSVIASVESGRREALRLIKQEATDEHK
jgi:hypothetical protein